MKGHKTNFLPNRHGPAIYRGRRYSMFHKFRGFIEGVVIFCDDSPLIIMGNFATGMYVNLGFCTNIKEVS